MARPGVRRRVISVLIAPGKSASRDMADINGAAATHPQSKLVRVLSPANVGGSQQQQQIFDAPLGSSSNLADEALL